MGGTPDPSDFSLLSAEVGIAEIEYRAWTHDGKLRHASYKGLREVQDNAAVFNIE
ncbi:ATP-dependent DNA ligase [Rhizobium tibeticum]|nr:ATP-dependent DNA ligase [Rhizobium tibeticum]